MAYAVWAGDGAGCRDWEKIGDGKRKDVEVRVSFGFVRRH